jgi:hypothetical protein
MLPAATSNPALTGIAAVGRALATTNGTWNTSASFTYQWLRCSADGSDCGAIAGASATTYAVDAADANHVLKAVVSATNAAGTTSATSAASALVVATPHAGGAPRISGRAKVGEQLTASHGTWSGPPTSYAYQWLRCSLAGGTCALIRKATGAIYRLTRHDAGHRLRVRVTARNIAGSKAATSAATKRVRR